MLSVVEISNRIKNPNLIAPDDLLTLQELSGKYPYTQLFSILYLKSLSKAGDPRFEEELSRHSYRISDRVQLYELIQDHEENEPVSISERSVIVEEAPNVIENPIDAVIEPQEEIEVKSEEQVIAPIGTPPIEITPIDTAIEAPVLAETIEAEPELEAIIDEEPDIELTIQPKEEISFDISEENIESEEIQIEAKDNLEESILHHAFAANYRLDDLTDEEIEKLEVQEESKEETETLPVDEKIDSQASSFTSWLKANNNYSEGDSADKKAINAVVEDFSDFDPSSELFFGEIEKPKTEFYSPAKKARKSLEEKELPVSETLAKIYIMQGNYPQAISAYKQLSLSFPEKNIFFAHLIEDLEKKINR